MKHQLRVISLLLVLSMVFPMIVGFTSFEEADNTQAVNETLIEAPETNEELVLPDIVSREEAKLGGYVERLKEKETDLNTLIFKNGDGTNTMQVYGHPVKYVDEFGKIQDISLEVKANTDGGFVSAAHSVTTKFEKKLSDGISLKHEDVNVKLVPSYRSLSLVGATVSADKKQVSYSLDSKTSYVYELTYLGFKEDIVVKEYTGQTEYNFTIYTNGLTLVCEDGSYYLADGNGDIKASIGDIIVFTADERNNTFGKMTHETVRAGQEYTMTIHLDADYLKDEKTLYPIRIDPTLQIVSAGTAGFIEDVTLNSNAGSAGASTAIMIGTRSSYGISRVLMRFPTLSLDGIAADDIVTATIGLRDIICQSREPFVVECRTYDKTAPAWSESAPPTFTTASSYIGAVHDTYTVTYNGGTGGGNWYSFDIKTAAQAWANGTQDPAKGLIFKAVDSHENQTTNLWYKTFGSYNRSNYKPSLKIVYNAEILLPSSLTILEGEERTLNFTTNAPSVTWASDNEDVATVDQNGTVTGVRAGTATVTATITGTDGTTDIEECTVYVCLADGIYFISNQQNNSNLFVKNLRISDNTNVGYCAYDSSAAETQIIRQLWKITHLGMDRYSIRPLHNLSMGLSCYSGNADIIDIGATDTSASIVDYAEWAIEGFGSSYFIKSYYESSSALQLDTYTGLEENVLVSGLYEGAECLWTFSEPVNIPTGVLLYNTETGARVTNPTVVFEPNAVKTLADMNLYVATYPVYNQSLSWGSSHIDKANINPFTGTVTAIHYGNSIITGTLSEGETVQFTVDIMSIPEGTYFLRNKQVGYYADIENPAAPSEGMEIHQWEFHGGNSQKWIFEYVSSGYYTLKSANYTTAYYLGVENDSTAQSANIVLRTSNSGDGTKWRITVTDSGAYLLTSKTGNGVLSTNTTSQIAGEKLIRGAYTNDLNYTDEWGIVPGLTMALFAIPDEDDPKGRHDHSSALTSVISMGGWSTYTFLNRDATPSEVKLGLDTKDIYISRSHGSCVYYSGTTDVSRTGILLNDIPPSSNTGIGLWSHYESGISSGSSYILDTEDYSNISMALFVACKTGAVELAKTICQQK